jgi:tellurite resistance protein TerC
VIPWIIFAGSISVLLAIDLFAHRGENGQSTKAATTWSIVWIATGLAFGLVVWLAFGGERAQDYFAAYLIEKSLSVDNLFVFLVIFQSLKIPEGQQHQVLFFGVLGALVFRAIFIVLGANALEEWQWVNYVFGAILLYAAFRSVRGDPAREENKLVTWLCGHVKLSPFIIAIIGLELTDIMFAIDSVPAALSITRHKFVVYSSNAFAILGLRSLYVVLAKVLADLRHLHYGIAGVLAFTGIKMIIHEWVEIPSWLSIIVIAVIIAIAVYSSVRTTRAKVSYSSI